MMIVMTENVVSRVCFLHVHSTPAAMTIGFTSMRYTARETKGQVTVCVDVINPPVGGALQPFIVAILPEIGVFLQEKNSRYFSAKLTESEKLTQLRVSVNQIILLNDASYS